MWHDTDTGDAPDNGSVNGSPLEVCPTKDGWREAMLCCGCDWLILRDGLCDPQERHVLVSATQRDAQACVAVRWAAVGATAGYKPTPPGPRRARGAPGLCGRAVRALPAVHAPCTLYQESEQACRQSCYSGVELSVWAAERGCNPNTEKPSGKRKGGFTLPEPSRIRRAGSQAGPVPGPLGRAWRLCRSWLQ